MNSFTAKPGDDLYTIVAKLTEYYFSPASLEGNLLLRQHMNEQGWVPISLMAGFHQVKRLVKGIPSIEFISVAVRDSEIVETKNDMIRKSNDWMEWILPEAATNKNHLQSEEGNNNKIKDRLQKLSTMDNIEDIQKGFYKFTCELPIRMDEDDKQMAIEVMEVLLKNMQGKYSYAKGKYGEASFTYSAVMTEVIDKYPDFVELFSDEHKNRFDLLDAKIAENKLEKPDEGRLKELQKILVVVEDQSEPLLDEVLKYGHIVQSVESYIKIVDKKEIA